MDKEEKYVETAGLKDATHLKVSVFYDKGGYSYFSGQNSRRGYYLSVSPVTVGNGMISFDLFSNGVKKLLLETKRFSEKQFQSAVEISKQYESELITHVTEQNKAA